MKRAVIVGCGNIAAVHAAVLTAQKGYRACRCGRYSF